MGSPDPMIEAGAPSTGGYGKSDMLTSWCCARPTGGSHVRTTGDYTQRFKDAKRKPRQARWGGLAQPVRRAQIHWGGSARPRALLYVADKVGASAERHILHTVIAVWFRSRRTQKGRSPKAPTRRMKRPGRGGRRDVL
jgi:hypothetical protein